MALAALPVVAQPVSQGIQTAVKVLTTDLVVLRHRWYRRIVLRVPTGKLTKSGRTQYRREERLEPLDVEFHLNPVGLAALGIGAAVVGFVAFGRINTIFGEAYKGPLADEFDAWKGRQAEKRSEERGKEDPRCGEWKDIYDISPGSGPSELARRAAKEAGCAWAG